MPSFLLGEGTAPDILNEIGDGLTGVIGWVGDTVDSLLGADGSLQPLLPALCVGIGVSALLLGIKVIRNLIWGA